MSENKYFQEALSSFTAEFAYMGGIKHLHDLGLSVDEIRKKLSYPVSAEKIEKVISDYEEEKKHPEACKQYVQDIDQYGRKSFRRL